MFTPAPAAEGFDLARETEHTAANRTHSQPNTGKKRDQFKYKIGILMFGPLLCISRRNIPIEGMRLSEFV